MVYTYVENLSCLTCINLYTEGMKEIFSMHPIEIYLLETGKSVDEYATSAGLSRDTIYKYIQGVRKPRRQQFKKLTQPTGGKITIRQLLQYYSALEGDSRSEAIQ